MSPIALRAKLALVYAAVLTVLLGGFGLGAFHLLADQLDDAANARVQSLTDGLHGYLRLESGLPQLLSTGSVERVFIRADSLAPYGPVLKTMAIAVNSGINWSVVAEPYRGER